MDEYRWEASWRRCMRDAVKICQVNLKAIKLKGNRKLQNKYDNLLIIIDCVKKSEWAIMIFPCDWNT